MIRGLLLQELNSSHLEPETDERADMFPHHKLVQLFMMWQSS